MSDRIDALIERFHSLYGAAEPGVWSAPGRTEISGNHTDHQHGKVLAASVNMDMLAAAAPNGTTAGGGARHHRRPGAGHLRPGRRIRLPRLRL